MIHSLRPALLALFFFCIPAWGSLIIEIPAAQDDRRKRFGKN